MEYLEDDVETLVVVGVERLDDVESEDDVDVEEEEVEWLKENCECLV